MTEDELEPEVELIDDKKEEDTYDYNFDIYESEDDNDEDENNNPVIDQLVDKKQPMIRGLKSKYSNWSAELDRIAELSVLISKYAIKAEANTPDVQELWKFFAVMNELWESMRYMFGQLVVEDVKIIRQRCKMLLHKSSEDNMHNKVHNNLLYYRHQLYRLRQSVNLGLDLEKTRRGFYHKAKRKIVQ